MSTILVTGTGGGAGQSVLKSLQRTDYRVIACDGEVFSAVPGTSRSPRNTSRQS